ncbi:MAG: cobalamin biosynthesis protein CbiX [Firmicutes bacterium]|nr:cobalamin biosynthesis protein CbiX [Bacillota bacterium]
MAGILILAHGSRQKETEKTLKVLVNKVQNLTGAANIETAFLQFSDNSLPAGLDRLANKGCSKIHIIPYFLFDGVHIREDIPAELAKYKAEHPEIELYLDETLGADDRLAAILAERVQAALQ